ncbi:MAG: hypothetical protein ACTSPG_09480 [Candidatus Hodarchaeales archaeon]
MKDKASHETFLLDIEKIHPSQLYLNIDKLKAVPSIFSGCIDSLDPIPIKKLDNLLVATDGHSRLFFLWQCGYKKVRVVWEVDELDWKMYRICVDWCKNENITKIADLRSRIVNNEDYERLWINRCHEMQKELDKSNSK